jgi:hypothetical protein
MGLQGASNDGSGKKDGHPEGCARIDLWLRCSSVTEPSGYAPSSRLARGQFWRSAGIEIYLSQY